MWDIVSNPIVSGFKYSIVTGRRHLSFGDVVQLWQSNSAFAEFFSQLILSSSFKALRWELPALTKSSLDSHFECVVIDAPELERPADPSAFSAYFQSDSAMCTFENLGKDAYLIAPVGTCQDHFTHLAAFLRHAPQNIQVKLWQTLAEALYLKLGTEPQWLSTSGDGVAWLHIRIDTIPKYYRYHLYANACDLKN